MITRRVFIGSLAGGLLAAPLTAEGQPAGKIPRIGVLWHAGSVEEEAIYLEAFRRGLRDLGYVEGRNIALENRFAAERYERFQSLATELIQLKVDVIVAVTPPAALAAQRSTTTVPVVFVVVPDPVRIKLVNSLAWPGGNITGLSNLGVDLSAKRLQLLTEAVVGLSRVAILVNPGNQDVHRHYVEQTQAAASVLRVTIRPVEVRAPEELERAFSQVAQDRANGVIVPPDGMFYNERELIAALALKRRLPTMLFSKETVEPGGLTSYGPNNPDLFRRAAAYVDKILKGAKPADLPVEQPTKFELVINVKTAKALGLTIPQSLLLRADEVIQ